MKRLFFALLAAAACTAYAQADHNGSGEVDPRSGTIKPDFGAAAENSGYGDWRRAKTERERDRAAYEAGREQRYRDRGRWRDRDGDGVEDRYDRYPDNRRRS